jgi:hypothetical protein
MTQPTLFTTSAAPEAEAEPLAEAETHVDEAAQTPEAEIPAADNQAAVPTQTAEEDDDELSPVEREPYEFDRCTLTISLQLLPTDGDPGGRRVLIGVRNHLDQPIIQAVRESELGPLPSVISELLEQLKADLPSRQAAFEQAQAKRQAEAQARQARLASLKTASSKGKTTKQKKNWNTAPASEGAVTAPETTQPPTPSKPSTSPTPKPAHDGQSTQISLFS